MEFDYESERLDPAIAYYGRRSVAAKRRFYALQGLQLVAATLITVLAALDAPKPIVVFLGAAATLAAGLLALGNWQQLWLRYRATAETLKHEKYLHRALAGPYAQGRAGLLAERCEAVVSSEHSVWATAMEHVGEARGIGKEAQA
jgi:Protein of unknown function (DUF4231)